MSKNRPVEQLEELVLVGKVRGNAVFALKKPKGKLSQSMHDLKIERLRLHFPTMDSRLTEFGRLARYVALGGKLFGLGLLRGDLA